MAACFDPISMPPQLMQCPPQQAPVQQAPVTSCIGMLYDTTSNRTFRIPDVPATSSVAQIKQWYSKNVTTVDPRALAVLCNGQPVDDSVQVWQLAQGQGQFSVTMTQAQISPRSILTVHVSTSMCAPVALQISSDSTVLYVKQRVLELINQPMALASCPQTTLIAPLSNSPLQNSHTLDECGVQSNAQLSLSFVQQNAAKATPPQVTFSRIQQIWSAPGGTPTQHPQNNSHTMAPVGIDALLPSLLLDDEDEVSSISSSCSSHSGCSSSHSASSHRSSQKGRGGKQSHSTHDELSHDQLQHLAANFRTKMCRNGPCCKFGKNCWFAHNAEEARKPSDPLPKHLPAVHKLERYSHRDSNKARRSN